MFQMLGVFAEFERSMIQDRVKAGLNRAKANGKILGRPLTNDNKEAEIIATLNTGTGILKTAKLHCVGTSVVQRLKKQLIHRGK